ncbi:MAG: cellulase family glycosylhydrolase [Bacteroidales bacterium]
MWKANYAALAANGAFTINLMNEWGSHNVSAATVAQYYNEAIAIVRQVYSGYIIIDCPGWGQESAIMAAAVKGYNTGGVKINDTKIVLSMHIYPGAWNQAKNRWVNTSDIDDLASAGRPCIIGEFGNGGSGGCDWSAVVDYAKSKGWTILGWCWNGDGGSMNMVTPSWAQNPTATSFSLSSYFSVVYNKL